MLGKAANSILNPLGYRLTKMTPPAANTGVNKDHYPDFEAFHWQIIDKVKPYTMTSVERLYGLIEAVKFIVDHKIPGDIVECGVWRGGSMMAVAFTLLQLGCTDRRLYMFDTYEGMSTPSDEDIDLNSIDARQLLTSQQKNTAQDNIWCYASLDDVQANMSQTGYNKNQVCFIKGKVEDTLPGCDSLPGQIALLRLDTDWYESTKTEMEFLYPRLVKGGFFIADDYGHWKGSRKAIDEYLAQNAEALYLSRMDYTGRIGRR